MAFGNCRSLSDLCVPCYPEEIAEDAFTGFDPDATIRFESRHLSWVDRAARVLKRVMLAHPGLTTLFLVLWTAIVFKWFSRIWSGRQEAVR
jgi:hypothetical protein